MSKHEITKLICTFSIHYNIGTPSGKYIVFINTEVNIINELYCILKNYTVWQVLLMKPHRFQTDYPTAAGCYLIVINGKIVQWLG